MIKTEQVHVISFGNILKDKKCIYKNIKKLIEF